MEEKRRYYRLGLFVIVTLAILFAILFVLGGRSLFAPTLTFETYFNQSVQGLEIGSPVSFRGIPLGKVVEIESTAAVYERDVPFRDRKGYILVRGRVSGTRERVETWRRELGDAVKYGLRAQTQLAGITGQQYLALDMLDPQKNPPLDYSWKPKYLVIPSAPSLTGEIISGMQKFLASLNEADVAALGQSLNQLANTINTKLDQLDLATLSAEGTGLLRDARGSLKRIDALVAELKISAGRVDKLLADPGLGQTVDNTAAFTARLRAIADSGEMAAMLKNLDELIVRTNALVGDNQYDVRVIVEDLRATAANLRTLSETVKRYPAGALIGGPPAKTELPKKESK